jgi:hypothetical protein
MLMQKSAVASRPMAASRRTNVRVQAADQL